MRFAFCPSFQLLRGLAPRHDWAEVGYRVNINTNLALPFLDKTALTLTLTLNLLIISPHLDSGPHHPSTYQHGISIFGS